MNACVNMIFWEGDKRIPEGDHTLKPQMRQGPNSNLGVKDVSSNRRSDPSDHAQDGKKRFV
jgi:hypothetical protein